MKMRFPSRNALVNVLITCLLTKNSVEGWSQYNLLSKTSITSYDASISRNNIITDQRDVRLYLSSDDKNNDRMNLGKGSYVALVTPMTSSGDIDFDALRSLLKWHVQSETDGLCILGTTGEATTLSMQERESVLKVAVEEVKGKIPILCGTGTINPNSVKELTQQAIDLGCDGALVVTPYYVKPPQRALVKHFTDIADMGLPVILYNVPGRTACDMSIETIALCSQHQNIVGLKDATGDLSRVETTRTTCGDDFLLLSGDDATSADFVLKGGDGCISVTANLDPAKMHKMISRALDGDKDSAFNLNANLEMLHEKLFVESNPIAPKWALNRIGRIPTAYCRPPLDELDSGCYSIVEEALKTDGLI